MHIASNSKQNNQSSKGQNIGYQGSYNEELRKLDRGPRSLKVSPAIEKRNTRYRKCEYIVLNQSCSEKGPRIYEGELGHE